MTRILITGGGVLSGVYIHIPFCKSKCPYCNFYSYCSKENEREFYVNALLNEITTLSRCNNFLNTHFTADTLYLGGGTPSVLTGRQLFDIITTTKSKFNIKPDAEITVECNPASHIEEILPFLIDAGVNRISLGLQSAIDKERKTLGRASSKERVQQVIDLLIKNGIENISLDVMLGIPYQTAESLDETLNFAINSGAKHISSYILKIEENTHFYKHSDRYEFPDEDTVCDFYSQCFEKLQNAGFNHYEISNAALPGFESRHNTKYWTLDNYLGIGPGAHSYINGTRFYFQNNTQGFINGDKAVFDSYGGDYEEFIMLSLRLSTGLDLNKLSTVYEKKHTEKIIKKAPFLKEQGLINIDSNSISLTEKGFLLSNTIISELI